jgi:hypothetical protein
MGFDFQRTPDLLQALPHAGQAMSEPQLLGTTTVVLGSYRNSALSPGQLDPEVSGRRMPNGVGNNFLDTSQYCVCRHGVINRQAICNHEVDLWRGNTSHQRFQRLGERDWILPP